MVKKIPSRPSKARHAPGLPSHGRRERRSAETRERLFRSALDLFARKGFMETTVGDITEAADLGKGTFFNYFPSKDHILLAFGEMQLAKLQAAVEQARRTGEPMPQFLRSLGVRMTQEPIRNPGVIRTLLQAYLSTTPVRAAMLDLQKRVHALHTEIVELGQERGEIRKDLPATEIAHVFRQTIFGTLLFWSLYGDATLHPRMESAFNVLWSGLAPRNLGAASAEIPQAEAMPVSVPLFTCGD
ncbi:MAG TPA: TetR/AcrR family transcriptional regulator [Verrucomicrobiae bacterium]|jgi:AcrR family transcriptional regulator|nr:TetR/AcrR family transcriptional regulator [Verrucomicrobiae bacterium]